MIELPERMLLATGSRVDDGRHWYKHSRAMRNAVMIGSNFGNGSVAFRLIISYRIGRIGKARKLANLVRERTNIA